MKSPAGRTIQTIYPASYADEISIFDFNMRPGGSWQHALCATGPSMPCVLHVRVVCSAASELGTHLRLVA